MSSIIGVTPYLVLNGKAEQAIELYQRALGAELQQLRRFGDVDKSCPDASKDRIMHAELRLGNALLMLSDGAGVEAAGGIAAPGGRSPAINVALGLTDPAETRRCFDALAGSGTVLEPLTDAPWGGMFGVLRDAMGITWMLNCVNLPE